MSARIDQPRSEGETAARSMRPTPASARWNGDMSAAGRPFDAEARAATTEWLDRGHAWDRS